MSNQFLSPEGDLEEYFVSEYWLIDQYIGDQLWTWGSGSIGRLGNAVTTGNISTPVTTFAGGSSWKQVSSRGSYTAAIKTDGTLWTWGSGFDGQLGNAQTTNRSTPVTTFAGGTNWKQVSSGDSHTAAIKTDGTLWTWGNGGSGQLGNGVTTGTRSTPVTTFAGGTNWKQVSAGNFHTAAIKTDGTLWTWGLGSAQIIGPQFITTIVGGLGTNDLTDRSTPVTTFIGGTNWKQVSSGDLYTAAIKTDGTLWTWGYAGSGQLGSLDAASFKLTPVTTFAGGTNWADTATTEPEDLYTLSSGRDHTAAIKTDGTLWTWGDGLDGQLGNAQTTNRSTPVTTFAGGTNWKQVSSGDAHTAAIKTDGTLWTWGDGDSGRLGNNQAIDILTPVTTFAGGSSWKQVSSGGSYTAAIKTDGTLWTWGSGSNGRLGNAQTTDRSTPVTTFAGGTNWKQVSSGGSHTAAIKTDGTLWTWGLGGFGRLGDATITSKLTPVTTFAGGTNWKQVSSGGSFTAAIKTDGTLWTWGAGGNGALGTNDTITSSTPVTTFAGGTNWKQVSSGNLHTAAIKTDGTLWTWGRGNYGLLGTNDMSNRFTPVTTFAGGSSWKQVSSGRDHTAAIKTDGVDNELYVFGLNGNQQLGINYNNLIQFNVEGTNWKQVSSGDSHTAAIKTDGTLWTWGSGNYGRLGTNDMSNRFTPVTTFAGGTNWKQVASGYRHTAAIKTDGTLWTWGLGNYGRLGNAVTTGNISTPVTTFAGGSSWKQVSSGGSFTAAVQSGISAEYPLS
jgi:alpha-tubulin suppressor-like RCC1 family protein